MESKVLDIMAIKEILPYRYPMLLVDRVKFESEDKVIGLKNLSLNEEFFQGHFPNHPIFPGVLQVEAMEQVAELAVKERLAPTSDQDLYMKSLSRVKFRKPNNPGDRMIINVEVKKIENGEAEVSASTTNKSGVTCQANMVLALRPKTRPSSIPEEFTECDKSSEIKMDINGIMGLIPHRYPFLLVDYIVSAEGENVVAIKNVTYNEPYFQGYKKGYPVMPGAIQSEIIAQAGCVLMLSREENKGKIAYFMSIDRAVFHHPVFPGDQLILEVVLPVGTSRFGQGKGHIRVGDTIVSETDMKFALVEP